MLGHIKLPDTTGMKTDIQNWGQREDAVDNSFDAVDFQTAYVRDLMDRTDYPGFEAEQVAELLKQWLRDKQESILTYRDKPFRSVVTGTMAPIHHTAWLDELDDSLERFLNPHINQSNEVNATL